MATTQITLEIEATSVVGRASRIVVVGAAAVGPQGIQGPQGVQGNVGPQGTQGPQGDKGDKGDQGDQGPQGNVGPQGTQGPQGDKGDKGDQGDQGPQGNVGPQGTQGPQGPQGNVGPQGTQGPQGPSGVISVNDPITNSGTSTSADLGLSLGNGLTTSAGALVADFGATSTTVATGDRGLPVGGTTGQVLAKTSASDYASGWTGPIHTMTTADVWRVWGGTSALTGNAAGPNYRPFVDGSSTTLRSNVEVPTGAATVDIELVWANLSTNSGDVVWAAGWQHPLVAGSSFSRSGNQDNDTAVVATAGAQNIVVVTTLVSNYAITAGTRLMTQTIGRFGGAVADTLNGQAAGIALIYTWKS